MSLENNGERKEQGAENPQKQAVREQLHAARKMQADFLADPDKATGKYRMGNDPAYFKSQVEKWTKKLEELGS